MIDDPWLTAVLIALIIIIPVLGLFALLRSRLIIVPEGRQAVIYQMGKFHRLDGPGRVFLNRSVDTVVREINIRNEADTYRIDGLLSYGVPFGYTLNFWRRTDLTQAAAGSREKLVELAMVSDEDRRRHVSIMLRDALILTLSGMERDYPLPNEAGLVARITPVLPGLPQCNEMLARLKQNLRRSLLTVGVILDPDHPIVIQTVHLGEEITSGFARDRRLSLLRQQFPGFGDEMLMQSLSTIEGMGPPQQMSTFNLNSSQAARVELRANESGEMQPRIKMDAVGAPPSVQQSAGTGEKPRPQDAERLTAEDLAVLKHVPPYRGETKRAG